MRMMRWCSLHKLYTFLGIISVCSTAHIQNTIISKYKAYFNNCWFYIQIQNVLIHCNILWFVWANYLWYIHFLVCINHKNMMVMLLNRKLINSKGLVTTAVFIIGKSISILLRQNYTVSSICSHLGHIGLSSYGVTKYVFTTKSWFWNWRKNDTKMRIYRGMQSQLRDVYQPLKQHKQDICREGCGWSKVIQIMLHFL